MIVGIGLDLVEISRVNKACEKDEFIKKIFTNNEIELIGDNYVKAAGNFAVKEAVSKMLGTGFREFGPIDVEVLRNDLGKPYVNLLGKAKEIAKELNIHTIHVTISNTKDYANAVAIGES